MAQVTISSDNSYNRNMLPYVMRALVSLQDERRRKVLRLKYPIEYELNPTEMDKGKQWLTLTLKNTGNQTLERLDVELHSLDTFYLFPFIFPSGIACM